MNIELLDQDELAVEFLVRNIDGTRENGKRVLAALVAEENCGQRPRPPRPHPYTRTLTSELAEIKRKIFEIGSDLHRLVTSPDEHLFERCVSRVLHLRYRLDRSRTQAGYSEHIGRIEAELDGLMQRFRTLSQSAEQVPVVPVAAPEQPSGSVETVSDQRASTPAVVRDSPGNASEGGPPASSSLAVKSTADADTVSPNPIPVAPLREPAPPSHVPLPDSVPSSDADGQLQASLRVVDWSVPGGASGPPDQMPVSQHSIPAPLQVPALPYAANQMPVNFQAVNWAVSVGASGPREGSPIPQFPGHPMPGAQRPRYPEVFESSPYNPMPAQDPYPRAVAPAGLANGWTMLKWPLRFSGGARDLPVDEFIFRVETLARVGNVSEASLAYGLHQLLTEAANSWYWVFIRGQPNVTWPELRTALRFAFRSSASDAAIRRHINERLQQQGERFTEYCLAIQELALRLQRRMSEAELLEVLRRNLAPAYQDRLLFRPVANIHELQDLCQQIEEMWRSQNEVHQSRRPPLQVNEIAQFGARADPFRMAHWPVQPPSSPWWPSDSAYASQPPPPPEWASRSDQSYLHPSMQLAPPQPSINADPQDEQLDWVCAMDTAKRGEYTICWNCDDIGHTFMDCPAARKIFCYGCGAKNVVRPQCPKCTAIRLQGNAQRNGRPNPVFRGQPFQTSILQHPPNQQMSSQHPPKQLMPMLHPQK